MGLRTRRAVAALGVCLFLAFYVWAVVSIGARLPDNQVVALLYYAVAGLAWGVPIIPLLRWAEGGGRR